MSDPQEKGKSVIFRVQDQEGRGPYKPGMTIKWRDPEGNDEHRPPFWLDFGLSVVSDRLPGQSMGCGFRSIDQLLRWFSSSEIERMTSLGYLIVEMDVDRIVSESDKQLVFVRNRSLREDYRVIGVAFSPR